MYIQSAVSSAWCPVLGYEYCYLIKYDVIHVWQNKWPLVTHPSYSVLIIHVYYTAVWGGHIQMLGQLYVQVTCLSPVRQGNSISILQSGPE